jgi:UDP-N-acetylmuramyl tripeptide synthase
LLLLLLLLTWQVTSGETRARMGEVAHQRSEYVILTNSSPALESPADIMKVMP